MKEGTAFSLSPTDSGLDQDRLGLLRALANTGGVHRPHFEHVGLAGHQAVAHKPEERGEQVEEPTGSWRERGETRGGANRNLGGRGETRGGANRNLEREGKQGEEPTGTLRDKRENEVRNPRKETRRTS